ncbi:IS3 family transposase (plasmid) [Methylobacterium sp. P31]
MSRPHLASSRQASAAQKPKGRRGRPPAPDAELLASIQALIADLPTYGYRRVHTLLRRQAKRDGRPAPNAKRVYRVMKVHGLLLQRHAGGAETRRHEGKVAVAVRNMRIPTKPAGDSDLKPAVIPRRSRPPFRSEAGRWRRRSRGSGWKITRLVQAVKRLARPPFVCAGSRRRA